MLINYFNARLRSFSENAKAAILAVFLKTEGSLRARSYELSYRFRETKLGTAMCGNCQYIPSGSCSDGPNRKHIEPGQIRALSNRKRRAVWCRCLILVKTFAF